MCFPEGQHMQGLHLVEVLLTLALLHQYPVGPPGLHVVLCPSVPCLALRLCPQSLSLPHLQPRVAWRGDEPSARAISVTSLSPMGRSCPTAQCFSVHISLDMTPWTGRALQICPLQRTIRSLLCLNCGSPSPSVALYALTGGLTGPPAPSIRKPWPFTLSSAVSSFWVYNMLVIP